MTDSKRTDNSDLEAKAASLSRSEQRKKNRQENRGQKKSDGGAAIAGPIKRMINFFIEAKEELGRVVWPTRKETIDSTWRLLILVILAGIYLGIVDSILNKILGLIV